MVPGAGGVRIRLGHHAVPGAKADCLLLPGLGDFLEKRADLACDLGAMGHAIWSLDWRRQGLSDRLGTHRRAAHLRSYDDLVEDIDALLRLRDSSGRPLWLLGYSMGALAALLWRTRRGSAAPTALVNPMLRMRLPAPEPVIAALAGGASLLGRGRTFAAGEGPGDPASWRFEDNTITEDETHFAGLRTCLAAHPAAVTTGTTWGWVRASIWAMREARALRPSDPSVLLVALTLRDRSVDADADAARRWADRLGVQPAEHKGGHDLFLAADLTRGDLLRDVAAFACHRLGAGRHNTAPEP